jgi:hypothetical protein
LFANCKTTNFCDSTWLFLFIIQLGHKSFRNKVNDLKGGKDNAQWHFNITSKLILKCFAHKFTIIFSSVIMIMTMYFLHYSVQNLWTCVRHSRQFPMTIANNVDFSNFPYLFPNFRNETFYDGDNEPGKQRTNSSAILKWPFREIPADFLFGSTPRHEEILRLVRQRNVECCLTT